MTDDPPNLPGVSIVILNWNGVDLLKACLPSIVETAGRYPEACQVMVVDNGSTDDSQKIAEKYGARGRIEEPGNEFKHRRFPRS